MLYLAEQIFWWLVIAFLVGGAIGWLNARHAAKSRPVAGEQKR
ncbi:MAG: hypothetical protein VYD64_05890 [Pseudomonadota bacterium]|nr:hypothetical protein [Pseudomonadota bacterium]